MTPTEFTTWFIMAPMILLFAWRTVLAWADRHPGGVAFYFMLSVFIGRIATLRLQSNGGRSVVNGLVQDVPFSVTLFGSDQAYQGIGLLLLIAFIWYLIEDQGRRLLPVPLKVLAAQAKAEAEAEAAIEARAALEAEAAVVATSATVTPPSDPPAS